MPINSLSLRILNILESEATNSYNASAIDRFLYGGKDYKKDKERIAKIRVELKRLVDRKKIQRRTRGFYQAKPSRTVLKSLESPPVELHGIKLECELFENNKKGMGGIPSQNNIIGNWLTLSDFEPTSNNRWSLTKWWERRKITFTVHSSGLLEIFIRASNYPFDFPDFLRCLDWLNGFLEPVTPFRRREVSMVQVAVARDFEYLELDGVKSVSLRKYVNDWNRIYQHGDKVRFEHHATLKVSLEDVVNSLMLLTTPAVVNGNGNKPDERVDVV